MGRGGAGGGGAGGGGRGGGGKGYVGPLSIFFFGGGGCPLPPPLRCHPLLLPTPMDIVDDGKQMRNQIISYAQSRFQQW